MSEGHSQHDLSENRYRNARKVQSFNSPTVYMLIRFKTWESWSLFKISSDTSSGMSQKTRTQNLLHKQNYPMFEAFHSLARWYFLLKIGILRNRRVHPPMHLPHFYELEWFMTKKKVGTRFLDAVQFFFVIFSRHLSGTMNDINFQFYRLYKFCIKRITSII